MIYLDNAATSFPKPESVYKGVIEAMTIYGANPGRGSHAMAIRGAKAIYETRELIAKLFNCKDPLSVIFTSNATDSLNLAIKGILKPGDHVVTTSMEHNSVLRPIFTLEKKGVQNTIVECEKDGSINIDKIEKAIKENTKLVVTTHVSNLTGTIMPIKKIGELCKKRNVVYLVDAAQSSGVLKIDLEDMNIDLLAFPGHKGLLGLQGTGGLIINSDIVLEGFKEGGTGSKSSSVYQPDFLPDKYESGTPNLPGIVGLNMGIKYILNEGQESILRHEKKIIDLFIDKLKKVDNVKIYGPRDSINRSGVVSLNIKDMDSAEVAYILDSEYEIAVRSGLHCAPLAHKTIGTENEGAVRFSFGPFNTEEEIIIAANAIKEISQKK